MVSGGKNHYMGRGPACDLGNEGEDLKLLKKRVAAFAHSKRDRGLVVAMKDWKE